jgi:hypothetical protein
MTNPSPAAVDTLLREVGEYLHHGRHVATEGPDAGAFPLNRIDADAAISLVRVMFSYISRALAVANAAADRRRRRPPWRNRLDCGQREQRRRVMRPF